MRRLAWALALVAAGCHHAEDGVVARVGQRLITVAEYDDMAAKLLRGPYRNLQPTDLQAKRKLLDAMVAKELLVQLGLNRRLDQDSAIAPQVQHLEEEFLLKALFDRAARAAGELTDPEVELFYYEQGYDQEIRVSAVSCTTVAEAEQVLAALRRGMPFEALARGRQRQPPGSRPGGDLGFMPPADLLPEVRSHLLSLEPGQYYPEPLLTRYGPQVAKVTERRTAPFAERRAQVTERLRRLKRLARIAAITDSLKQCLGFSCSAAVVGRLVNDPTAVSPREPVCTWSGGTWSAEELLRRESRTTGEEAAADPRAPDTTAMRSAEEGATRKLLLAEARRRGYLDQQARDRVRQERDELMAARLYADVTRDLAVTEAEIESYWRAHPEEYGPRPAVDVQEILVGDLALAEELRPRLEAGADMAALADQYGTREATRQRHGQMRLWRRENESLGLLAPAALDAETGVLHGPLQVPGGYSLFKVLARATLPARPYAEVRQGIAAVLRAARQDEAMTRFLEELRAEHQAAITVYPSALASTLRTYAQTATGVDSTAATGL